MAGKQAEEPYKKKKKKRRRRCNMIGNVIF
jgi:hypothetical protein